MTQLDLNGCQCPFCKSSALRLSCLCVPDTAQIYDNGVVCDACGQDYDLVWGVPFLGVFEEADVLSLIEIAANADNYKRESRAREGNPSEAAGLDYARWHDLLDGYHLSQDRQAFLAGQGVPAEVSSWFPNRYGEHVLFRSITAGLDLAGKNVLDVGAGSGFDSYKFVRAGSNVTCFEFSPVLAHEGVRNIPQGRWIGGSSKVLPFTSSTFDLVVANASLHHIRDIPHTIGEMLRVLKPGGYLLTLCDSYRMNGSGEEVEINVFKDNASVLMGVNEGIPPLSDFLSMLLKHRDQLDIRVFTSEVHGVQHNSLTRKLRLPRIGKHDVLHPREWPLDEALELLPTTSGGLALLVRLRSPIREEGVQPATSILRPAIFARSLDSQATATAVLARHIPPQFVDLSLLDEQHEKFCMLNGWKPLVRQQPYRTAYSRARSFQTYHTGAEALRVSLLAPHLDRVDRPKIELLVNGRLVATRTLCRGIWTEYVEPIDPENVGSVVAIEVRIAPSLADENAKIFHVRELAFGSRTPEKIRTVEDLEHYGIEALAEIGLLKSNPTRLLLSSDYSLAISTLNRLRAMGLGAEIIVAKEQEQFFASEPNVKVIGIYEEFVKAKSRPASVPVNIALIAAPDLSSAGPLHSLVTEGNELTNCFVVLPGGHTSILRSEYLARTSNGEQLVAKLATANTSLRRALMCLLK
jgi:SAM-dependent methyltransferase